MDGKASGQEGHQYVVGLTLEWVRGAGAETEGEGLGEGFLVVVGVAVVGVAVAVEVGVVVEVDVVGDLGRSKYYSLGECMTVPWHRKKRSFVEGYLPTAEFY